MKATPRQLGPHGGLRSEPRDAAADEAFPPLTTSLATFASEGSDRAFRRLMDASQPSIAALHGVARAGGVGLMASCGLPRSTSRMIKKIGLPEEVYNT